MLAPQAVCPNWMLPFRMTLLCRLRPELLELLPKEPPFNLTGPVPKTVLEMTPPPAAPLEV